MSKDRHDSVFACKCLNVRIHPRKPPGDSASSSSSDSDFKPVYVGDDGLTIVSIGSNIKLDTHIIDPLHRLTHKSL